MQMVRRSEASP